MKFPLFALSLILMLATAAHATPVYLVVSAESEAAVELDDQHLSFTTHHQALETVLKQSNEQLFQRLKEQCDLYRGVLANQACITESHGATHAIAGRDASYKLIPVYRFEQRLVGKAYCRADSNKISYYHRFIDGKDGSDFECKFRVKF